MTKPRKPRKLDMEIEQYWRGVFLEFQKSGLPFRKFCEREGISPNSFQAWRKKLRERDEARGIKSLITKGDNRPSRTDEKTNFWLNVIDDANVFQGPLNQFCRERGVASGTLYTWEKKLIKEGLTSGLRRSSADLPALIPVRVVPDLPPKAPLVGPAPDEQRVEIRLHDGNRVLLPATLPAELLIQLLNGLRSGQ